MDAQPAEGYRGRLRFSDGSAGTVDISALTPFDGVFRLLKNRRYFRSLKVDPEAGTIVWPNGADLDPDVLYSHATGAPLPAV